MKELNIHDLLVGGDVPSLDQLLPGDFSKKFRIASVHQLGLATPDVATSASQLEAAGIGPFFIAEDDLAFWIERGEKKFFHGKFGVASFKGYELELLAAGTGSTFYSDGFRKDGKIALHHVGILDHGVDKRVCELNDSGIELAVRGKIKLRPLTIDFAYMDARKDTGLYVEFIDYRFAGIPIRPSAAIFRTATKAMKLFGVKELRMGTKPKV